MADARTKAPGAFLTISEVSARTGVAQHVLRYWETRFPELKPLQRAGNRRYYRPQDVALVERIRAALEQDGYTIRGVQQLLKTPPTPASAEPPPPAPAPAAQPDEVAAELRSIRDALKAALQRS